MKNHVTSLLKHGAQAGVLCSLTLLAAPAANECGTGGTGGTGGQTGTCLQGASGDYLTPGPYTVATKVVDLASMLAGAAAPTTYTIYYPATMETNCPHPIISWGNGTGVQTQNVYSFYHNTAASYGMVVIASDNPNVALAPYMTVGLDYLLAENNNPSSSFYRKLSTRAGTTGHSQGGFAATAATAHPNVQAEVQIQGAGTPKAGVAFLALSGSADTIVGTAPPTASYNSATGPAMLAIYTGADHITTPTILGWGTNNPGTIQYNRLYTSWFRCFLADDQNACAMFRGGSNCGMCDEPNWTTLTVKNY